MSYYVYLPPGYEQDARRYPVLYYLHGKGESAAEAAALLAPVLDRVIRTRVAPAMIVVLVHGLRHSYYCDAADGARSVEQIIVRELIPHIDSRYRSLATREARAVEGFSMGGQGALHLALSYPELFGSVTALAPGLYDPGTMASRQPAAYAEWFGGQAPAVQRCGPWADLARRARALAGRTHVRLLVGDRDEPWRVATNRRYHRRLTKLGLASDFTLAHGAGHRAIEIYAAVGDESWAFYRRAFRSPGPP